ncbi:hypothetical protein KZX47_11665 [Thermus sp. SYSU G05001]|uniref:Uncharacterized protein n=1 Tax=Thermus brevis TaxID=2862456 RepID=A0ABS7A0J1_9DEIN|nr:hypothetical protein [Thermus brevis]
MRAETLASSEPERVSFWAKSFPGKTVLKPKAAKAKALTNAPAEVRYPPEVISLAPNPEVALREGVKLITRLLQERLSGKGKVLGWRKSVEGEEYAIYVEVPPEVYQDIDLTLEIGAEVIALSDRLGVPFFAYFVPSQDAA